MGSILDEYSGFSPDAQAADKKEAQEASAGKFITKLEEGEHVYRVLPRRKGQSPWVVAWEHYVDIPGQENTARFVCPRATEQRPCRACTMVAKLAASPNPLDREKAQDMEARRNLYVAVLDRDNPKIGVRVFRFGKKIHNQLRALLEGRFGVDFTRPLDGTDVIVTRTGSGKNNTDYTVKLSPQGATPIDPDRARIEAILATELPDLDALAAAPSEQELEDILNGRGKRRDVFASGGQFSQLPDASRTPTATGVLQGKVVSRRSDDDSDL